MENKSKERPDLPNEILHGIATTAEDFQNKVLRPVIKMQSDLLILHLKNKLTNSKIDLTKLSIVDQKSTLTGFLIKDQAFKKEVIGMVIGQFSLEEYEKYSEKSKEINRRITQIVLNRSLDLIVIKE